MDTIIQSMVSLLAWPAPLKLRPLMAADAQPLAAMIVAVLAEFEFEWLATEYDCAGYVARKTVSLEHDLALCEAERAHTAFWVLVDTRDETPAGCVGIRRASAEGNGTGWGDRTATELASDTETAELHALYLARPYRGRGLGRRLYETAEAFAKACDYSVLWLESVARFTASKRLYEKEGFVLIDKIENKYEDEIMLKRLRPVTERVAASTTSGATGRLAAAGKLGGGKPQRPVSKAAAAAARFRKAKAEKLAAQQAAAAEAEAAAKVKVAPEQKSESSTASSGL